MTYTVEYFRQGEWKETHLWGDKIPTTETEVMRFAARRSDNGMLYRALSHGKIIAQFQHGNQLPKEANK